MLSGYLFVAKKNSLLFYTLNNNVLVFLCRHLHLELCQLIRELNAIYEIQITMEMVSHLMHFIRIFCYIYINLVANDYISSLIKIDFYIWLFLHATTIFCINYMCESVSAKVNLYKILKI